MARSPLPFRYGRKTRGGRAPSPPRPLEGPPLSTSFTVLVATTERLDRFLADQLQLSRTQTARFVAAGALKVNGEAARASRLLVRGDAVELDLPEGAEPPRTLVPHALPLAFVYEDEDLAVLDKPSGLVVHPAPGHWDDTLVNALVARGTTLAGGAAGRPGIVHRLDRDTSGLLIIAKTDVAHRRLSQAIGARKVHRIYAALSWGHLDEDPLVIDAPIGRHPNDRKRMGVLPSGRPARTDATVVARFATCELLRLRLHTGRTHQIRVHLAHVGHPVVGDAVYHGGGGRRIGGRHRLDAAAVDRAATRQALHAAELRFRHPLSGAPVHVRSEWPPDLSAVLSAAGAADAVVAGSPLEYLRFFNDDD